MAEKYPINIWINEERYDKLNKVGITSMTEDVLAGMKVLRLYCTGQQKDRLLKLYPMAKYDSATTKSIELLPAEAKDRMFDLAVEKESVEIVNEFLNTAG